MPAAFPGPRGFLSSEGLAGRSSDTPASGVWVGPSASSCPTGAARAPSFNTAYLSILGCHVRPFLSLVYCLVLSLKHLFNQQVKKWLRVKIPLHAGKWAPLGVCVGQARGGLRCALCRVTLAVTAQCMSSQPPLGTSSPPQRGSRHARG